MRILKGEALNKLPAKLTYFCIGIIENLIPRMKTFSETLIEDT